MTHGSLSNRISDNNWKIEDRIDVIKNFLMRADEALVGPIYGDQDLSDPNGGIDIHFILSNDGKCEIEQTIFTDAEFNESIRLLRPFILSSSEIFLPKIAGHVKKLINDEKFFECDNLINWIESFVSFEHEFSPIYFYTMSYDKASKKESACYDNSTLALAYIYGKSVKVDNDKVKILDEFKSDSTLSVNMALSFYLKQIYRLVYITQRDINRWSSQGKLQL